MDDDNSFSKISESLLTSDSEEELYISSRRSGVRRHIIIAALTIVNIIACLITIGFGLSPSKNCSKFPQMAGAGDMQDALDSHAIEYEIRSYSKPLDYDRVSRKAVILNSSNRSYTGPPSQDIDADWDDLLCGECTMLQSRLSAHDICRILTCWRSIHQMTPAESKPFRPELKSLSHTGRYIFE